MTTDPVLAYAGPESRSIDVTAILFGGGAVVVRGVIKNAETSAGEAEQAFGDFGPIAWIAYPGDPAEIEFLEYTEPGTGRLLHRQVFKRERVSAVWDTCKLHMTAEATVLVQQQDFSGVDFGPDFAI